MDHQWIIGCVDENVKVGSTLPNPCGAAGPSLDCRKAPESVVKRGPGVHYYALYACSEI